MEVRQTPVFRQWLDGLADQRAASRIAQRIVRLQAGLFGDAKPVGAGVSEFADRLWAWIPAVFMRREHVVIILLCGGDKRSQRRDIARAKTMAAELEVE